MGSVRCRKELEVISSPHNHLDWLTEEIELLDRDIDRHLDKHSDLRQDIAFISSIPSVCDTTAAKVLAYIGDVRQFTSATAWPEPRRTCPAWSP